MLTAWTLGGGGVFEHFKYQSRNWWTNEKIWMLTAWTSGGGGVFEHYKHQLFN